MRYVRPVIPNIGPLEIAIVLVIALIVFGPKKLPSLGRSLGRGITEFKDGLTTTSADADDGPADETGTVRQVETPKAKHEEVSSA